MKKKLLSIFTAVCMMVSMVPFVAAAETVNTGSVKRLQQDEFCVKTQKNGDDITIVLSANKVKENVESYFYAYLNDENYFEYRARHKTPYPKDIFPMIRTDIEYFYYETGDVTLNRNILHVVEFDELSKSGIWETKYDSFVENQDRVFDHLIVGTIKNGKVTSIGTIYSSYLHSTWGDYNGNIVPTFHENFSRKVETEEVNSVTTAHQHKWEEYYHDSYFETCCKYMISCDRCNEKARLTLTLQDDGRTVKYGQGEEATWKQYGHNVYPIKYYKYNNQNETWEYTGITPPNEGATGQYQARAERTAATYMSLTYDVGDTLSIVTIPVANANLTYDGTVKTGIPEGTGYTITGNTGTNAGDYTAIATLEQGYKWSDGSQTNKNISWSIAKKDQDTPDLLGHMPTSEDTTDGKITGLEADKKYEYKVKDSEDNYTAVTEGVTVIENLAPATYLVRLSEDGNHNLSEDAEVIVRAYAATYQLTVLGGTASPDRELVEGDTITIVAEPPYEGKAFDKWIVMEGFAEVTFENESSPQTTFVMPAGDVKISATYKPVPSGGNSSYTPPAPPADPITNDGGNAAAGEAPSTKVDTKPVTTTIGGVKTTTGTVDAATGEKLVEKAVANKSEEVVVDVTTSNANASSAAGAKTEVALTENTVKELAEKTSAGLDIKTDNAVVSLDNEAVKEVAKHAGTEGEIKLTVETVKADNKEVRIEVKIETSNGAVTNFGAGNVKVTVPVTNQLKNKKVVCVYIDDEGNYTKMEGELNADGTYTFVTNHFSTYAIMEEAEADKVIEQQKIDKINTLIKEFKFKTSTKYTSKKNVKVTAKVLEGDISAITDMGYRVEYTFSRAEKKGGIYYKKKTATGKTYINTAGKKGKKYYYRVQLYVYDGDVLVGRSELKQSEYGVRTWKKK